MQSLLNHTSSFGFGLDLNVAVAPTSLIFSTFLIFSLDFLGQLLIINLFSKLKLKNLDWLRWQYPLIGGALLIIPLYTLSLIDLLYWPVIQIIAISLLLLGILQFILISKKFLINISASRFLKIHFFDALFYTYITGFLLIACSPTTNADALNYHIPVALSILNTGSFPFAPEWFSSRLAGGGELLIALGLAIGAEQFGTLYQFTGLLSIVSYFRTIKYKNEWLWTQLVLLALISTPVLLFLISTPKPQLAPVAMTTLALMLTVELSKLSIKASKEVDYIIVFSIICNLLMVAAICKLNFYISAFVIGSLSLYFMAINRLIFKAIVVIIICCILIILPQTIWKYVNFGGTFLDAMITPFPGNWTGTSEFYKYLIDYQDSSTKKLINIFIPSGFSTISSTLGLGLLCAFYGIINIPKNNQKYIIIFCSITVAIVGIYSSQKTARFLFEPYIWLLIAGAINNELNYKITNVTKVILTLITFQSVVMLGPLFFGIYSLTPGSFDSKLRDKVMEKSANGYLLMKWVDDSMPKNAKLMTTDWIGISPRLTISNEWMNYVPKSTIYKSIYFDRLREQEPDFILVVKNNDYKENTCFKTAYAGPFKFEEATRNPFNSGKIYNAWIFNFNYENIECLFINH